MKYKLLFLLEELKENYTAKNSTEIIRILCEDNAMNEADEFVKELENHKDIFNDQNNLFYDELAIAFAEDLAHYTLIYFSLWEPLFHYFNSETKAYLFKSALKIPINADATDYIKGFEALENDAFDVALLYFNNIDHFVASYFVGYCYLYLDNYENSIKQNEFFLDELDEFIAISNDQEINLLEDPDLKILKWNVYNDLGYAYNRIEGFAKAKMYYEKSLDILDINKAFLVFNNDSIENKVSDFEIFINNYIHCLTKTNATEKAIEVLKFVISKNPNDIYFYQSRLLKLEEKNKNRLTQPIAEHVLRIKKPFGISNFTETRSISKENLLEDLIIEQIKRGFKVFNKKLEVYQDDLMYGKQYPVKHCNGRLDLLLVDKDTSELYVVELKRNEGGLEVVQQVEKYMEGLSIEFGREVKGIICLHKPNIALKELVATKENIELFVYEFQFTQI